MTTSEFDSYRPPEPPRRRRRDLFRRSRSDDGAQGRGRARGAGPGGGRRRGGAADGSREMPMVAEAQFTSYYGRPIVKAPPWGHEISTYLFLGGLAGGSGLLALGAQLTGRELLRRNTRLTALGAVSAGAVALIMDLGRPERFLNMMRTVKVTSPMSLGSWILAGFSTPMGVAAASEIDRLTGEKLPLGPLRPVLRGVEGPSGLAAAVLAAPLAAYTAVLLSDTAVPTWHGARKHLPYVFVSSASLAAGGAAMVTTPTSQTGPARALAALGVIGDVVAMHVMKDTMHPAEAEPLETGGPGAKLKWAERLAIAGGIGTLFAGNRLVAAASGTALMAASALTRFGVLEAGLESTKDPKHVIEPQKDRLAARRAAGITDDSITTAG